MSATLLTNIDPRDNLAKARRMELVRFANANGHKDITPDMGATMIREILRSRGITRIAIPPRSLGAVNQERTPAPEEEVQQRLQQVQNQTPVAPVPVAPVVPVAQVASVEPERKWKVAVIKPTSEMTITELRQACKARGIKMSRRDNMQTLREKLG